MGIYLKFLDEVKDEDNYCEVTVAVPDGCMPLLSSLLFFSENSLNVHFIVIYAKEICLEICLRIGMFLNLEKVSDPPTHTQTKKHSLHSMAFKFEETHRWHP